MFLPEESQGQRSLVGCRLWGHTDSDRTEVTWQRQQPSTAGCLPGGSSCKEPTCQCRRPWFDPWVGKIPWRRDRLPTPVFLGFLGSSDCKEFTCNSGDPGLIPGLGRSFWRREGQPTPVFLPGESHGQRSLVDYSHGVAKSRTQLSN